MIIFALLWGGLIGGPALAQDAARPQGDAGAPTAAITGHITDGETGDPIPGVQVFYSGTMIGDASDNDGVFSLKYPPVASIDIGVTMLGYKYLKYHLDLESYDASPIDFQLEPEVLGLGAITVTDQRDKEWEKNIERLKKVLFSTTKFGKSCRLINPEVITAAYEHSKKILIASSERPVVIENHALGYRVTVYGLSLESHGDAYQWRGSLQFELLDPKEDKNAKNWAKHRREAHLGSFQHLLRSLITDTVPEEGFNVYIVEKPGIFDTSRPIEEMKLEISDSSKIVRPILTPTQTFGTYFFGFPETLLVIYNNENVPGAYFSSNLALLSARSRLRLGSSQRTMTRPLGTGQRSWVTMSAPAIPVDMRGNSLFRGEGFPVKTYGYLAWESLGELLPFEYDPLEYDPSADK